ncbi:uncharacterized protein LOC117643601 [Thrips palmi]|uniref:Uncharacterized protein LOC117643601 n=1 Tax=Thrips palmi TaxID=161013 RepID=A0A6P8YWB4_THRPL|nr:uncharacterized protein LOC117643601 [Thrips palmi]XP_034238468.1 uncharacterized protein LOC117643601 [Thrips palmi]
MSLTQTTTTRVEALQHRLQPATPAPGLQGLQGLQGVQQVRFRAAASASMPAAAMTASTANTSVPTLTRRFSFVWPFISKENAAGAEPFLKSRCSQLLRQFPAFLCARQNESTRTVRDLISRVLTQLKAVWLVLAVYMSLVVLLCLASSVLYTLVLAPKPLGLVFLVGCVAATGAIAAVSFNAKERARPQQQAVRPAQPELAVPAVTLQVPKLILT